MSHPPGIIDAVQTEAAITALTSEQYGLCSLGQLRKRGVSIHQVAHRLAARRLLVVHDGVYRLAGSTRSPEQSVLAACLAAGPAAVASHRSAAAIHGLRERPSMPEITVVGTRLPILHGVVVHRTTQLERIDRIDRDRIPATRVERTLLDLGAVVASGDVEVAAERAILLGLTTHQRLLQVVERAGGRGRRGTAALRTFLEQRDPHRRPIESVLELAFLRLLKAHRVELPEVQVQVAPGVRVDFGYPTQRLAVELDGRVWHSTKADFQRDRTRARELATVGWHWIPFTWADVHDTPSETVDQLRRLLGLSLSA